MREGNSAQVALVIDWLHQQGLQGHDGGDILDGLCQKLLTIGVDLERAVVGYLVFHPQFEAMNFTWQRGKGPAERASATLADILQAPSPFLEMQLRGIQEMRYRLDKPRAKLPYAFLEQLQRQGFTDYFALFQPFGTFADRTIWPDMPPDMKLQEGVTGSLGTKRPGGFTDRELEMLRSLAPALCVAVRVGAVLEMAETLLQAYLGDDAGRSVLRGHVRRGQSRTIHAVVWHSDLRGSTVLAESAPPELYLITLNQYYDCVVDAVMEHGGEVLKFIGDGVLAIFPFEPATPAETEVSQRALTAARDALTRLATINTKRREDGLHEIRCGIALHSGDLMYGNVGSTRRLDFTVMGPTVNEVVRLETLCKKLNVPLVISETVASVIKEPLRSLGSYKLPGIGRKIEVFG
ncbi:MAG TPA: adenylate/guanylate cyclase domain-containing protein [Aestuariivirgaceae bacterium]|nr:adenylate/guanylate cyclase domain-containing protein [Aestuariivirgaceae bacterium]